MTTNWRLGLALACALTTADFTNAQHSDVLIQSVSDRLTSGAADFDSGAWTLGARAYTGEFDSDFAVNNPGWNVLGAGSPDLPAGAEALPANSDLQWDFLPLKIDGAAANLFYWDGAGEVQFGGLPAAGYQLSLQSKSSGFIPVDGAPDLVAGEVIDNADSIGSVHRHRFFFLDDGDGDLNTDPTNGIYLFAIRTRVEGLDRSAPLYFLFGTPGITSTTLTVAEQWSDATLDDLTPDFGADFDGNLSVDGADFLSWQRGLGQSGPAALQIAGDADFNSIIDGADETAWQQGYGSSLATFAGASNPSPSAATVPEPGLAAIASVAFALLLCFGGRRRGLRQEPLALATPV